MTSYLLDTHAFIWAVAKHDILLPETRTILKKSPPLVSIASAWEIAIKRSIGRTIELPWSVEECILKSGYAQLRLSMGDTEEYQTIPLVRDPKDGELHRDPFDRMLVAQARRHGLCLVTDDPKIQRLYDLETIPAKSKA